MGGVGYREDEEGLFFLVSHKMIFCVLNTVFLVLLVALNVWFAEVNFILVPWQSHEKCTAVV